MAKSIVVDLDQIRKIISGKDLIQLKESLENYRTVIAQNRHQTSMLKRSKTNVLRKHEIIH